MDCYYCKAKKYCMAAAQPGSMMCLVNRMRYGGTHADDAPPRQVGGFCQYCGQPLREIGRERLRKLLCLPDGGQKIKSARADNGLVYQR